MNSSPIQRGRAQPRGWHRMRLNDCTTIIVLVVGSYNPAMDRQAVRTLTPPDLYILGRRPSPAVVASLVRKGLRAGEEWGDESVARAYVWSRGCERLDSSQSTPHTLTHATHAPGRRSQTARDERHHSVRESRGCLGRGAHRGPATVCSTAPGACDLQRAGPGVGRLSCS